MYDLFNIEFIIFCHIRIMSTTQWEAITNFTKAFIERPLNAAFVNPIDPVKDDVPDYFDYITNPMDLSTVRNKIETKQYETADQWYNDICLIYENAIKYHSQKQFIYFVEVAEYLLKAFKKEALMLNAKSQNEWHELLQAEMNKLGKIIEKSPVPQGIDDLVASSIKRAETTAIQTSDVPEMVTKLQNAIKQPEKLNCIIAILKKTQKDLSIQKDTNTLTIEIEKLNANSLSALNIFLSADL